MSTSFFVLFMLSWICHFLYNGLMHVNKFWFGFVKLCFAYLNYSHVVLFFSFLPSHNPGWGDCWVYNFHSDGSIWKSKGPLLKVLSQIKYQTFWNEGLKSKRIGYLDLSPELVFLPCIIQCLLTGKTNPENFCEANKFDKMWKTICNARILLS